MPMIYQTAAAMAAVLTAQLTKWSQSYAKRTDDSGITALHQKLRWGADWCHAAIVGKLLIEFRQTRLANARAGRGLQLVGDMVRASSTAYRHDAALYHRRARLPFRDN